jgi:hypothetical protein
MEKTKTTVTLVDCQLMWPKLAEPGKHNEEATPKYEVELQNLSKENIALLKSLDPPYTPNDGKKRVDREGESLAHKGLYCTPKSIRPVAVYDSAPKKMVLEQVAIIGNESRGQVTVHSYAYNVGGNKGVALGLDSVMVTEMKEYNRDASPYEPVEGGYVAPDLHEIADNVPF